MRKFLLIAALLALAPLAARADAPGRLGYQGRLLKADGSPESGIVDLTFKVYDAATGGDPKWTETQKVALTDGFYALFLGEKTPFTDGLFDGGERYLEIVVDGEAMLPRQQFGSVAYALLATDAVNVKGGRVDASRVDVGGKPVIDAQGQLVAEAGAAFAPRTHAHDASQVTSGVFDLARVPQGPGSKLDADTLDGADSTDFARVDALSGAGTVNDPANPIDWTRLKNVPPGLADGNDDGMLAVGHDGTLVGDGATTALGVNPSAVQLRVGGVCADGELIKAIHEDGTVECTEGAAADLTVTDVTAELPLVSSGGRQPKLGLTKSCAEGQILKWDGTNWSCATDLDTAPTAGSGIAIDGRAISLGACAAGQIWKSVGSSWVCAPDEDTTYTAGLGLLLDSGRFSIKPCDVGEILKWDGADWTCAADEDAGGTVTSVSATGPLSSTGGRTPVLSIATASASTTGALSSSDWSAFSAKVGRVDVATGGGLVDTGSATAPELGLLTTCTAGQMLKWNGTAWTCADDNDAGGTITAITAGAGLTGGTITSTGTIGIATGGVKNAMLENASVTVAAGTGLTGGGTVALGGTVTLHNDGVLAITSGGGVGATTSAGTVTLSTTAGGDLSGSLDGATVAGLRGIPLARTAPNDGEVLSFDLGTGLWTPAATVRGVSASAPLAVTSGSSPVFSIAKAGASADGYLSSTDWAAFNGKLAPGSAAGGDLSGTLPNPTVARLQGKAVATTAPASGEVLKWNGSAWAPAADADTNSGGTVTSISASAPLSVTNATTTPAITIAQATSTSAGYLSAADWSAFSAKQSSALASGKLWVGNSAGVAAPVVLGGDAILASDGTLTLATTGVTAGTYPKVTVDAKGRVTGGSALASSDVTNALGYAPANKAGDTFTGAVGIPAGTAGSPSLFVAGSPTTGEYSPGANSIATATNGVQRWKLDAFGNAFQGSGAQLAVAATDGFLHVAQVAGTPTGTPGHLQAGSVPLVVDPNGNIFTWATATSKWVKVAAVTAGTVSCSGPGVTQVNSATPGASKCTFPYAGAAQNLTVSGGSVTLNVYAWGAAGGGLGGGGAAGQGSLSLNGGDSMAFYVGGGGIYSNWTSYAGSGGGATYVMKNGTYAMVAGGGGGGGYSGSGLGYCQQGVAGQSSNNGTADSYCLANGCNYGAAGTNGNGGGAYSQTVGCGSWGGGGGGGAYSAGVTESCQNVTGGAAGPGGAGGNYSGGYGVGGYGGGGGAYVGGGGGGGWSGGGGGSNSSYGPYCAGGGGGSYTTFGTMYSGSNGTPGNAGSPYYVSGIGAGCGGNCSGGNGLVVVTW